MNDDSARLFRISGVVQGVGFRPFIYRLARELDLKGWVLNDTDGVRVHAEGRSDSIEAFVRAVRTNAPGAARVDGVDATDAPFEGHESFEIRSSADAGAPTTRISPDLCVCEDCLRELRDPADRRHGYAYINCTNCGPRYSIIRSLPYDRPRTTMAPWALCEACAGEYADPLDRRYHAQPTACEACGPAYRLVGSGITERAGAAAIGHAASMLASGSLLAIKGIGGYHLACDAHNEASVLALRERKFRKEKPFAVMVRDADAAGRLVSVDPPHRELLESAARPIVLAPARRPLPGVHPGIGEIGVMLAYTPLHHLLFDAGAPEPLVLTSANRSSEPIAYRDDDAFERLGGLADAFLVGERAIQRRVDDSVVSVRQGRAHVIRRARGYAPGSAARLATERPILAVGADLKNSIALAAGGEVFVSQFIGDLGEIETDRAYRETIEDLLAMYAIDRRELVVVHDAHPEYVSTRVALRLACADRLAVQHHRAHVASVLLEHGELDTGAVGVSLDGTGYGDDGTIWGGEIFEGSVRSGFRRVGSLTPVSMPGGDAAARCPVQCAAAYLPDHDPSILESETFGFPPRFRDSQAMIRRGTRCFTSTSAGRLFDAIAAVCGFTRDISFEGQAAIWLEQLARGVGLGDTTARPSPTLDPRSFVEAAFEQRLSGAEPGLIASRFHRDFAASLVARVREHLGRADAGTVVVSGGVWQNDLLFAHFSRMVGPGIRVLANRELPCNDGGISAGQIALASARTDRLNPGGPS